MRLFNDKCPQGYVKWSDISSAVLVTKAKMEFIMLKSTGIANGINPVELQDEQILDFITKQQKNKISNALKSPDDIVLILKSKVNAENHAGRVWAFKPTKAALCGSCVCLLKEKDSEQLKRSCS